MNRDKPVFFVASRGHHADIGGLTPGSMPPNSTSLLQEGAQFISFKVVEQGQFKEKGQFRNRSIGNTFVRYDRTDR